MNNQVIYSIEVQGKLRESWSDWFNGLTIEHITATDGLPITRLTGPVADQTALHGLLHKIRDLGLKLVSVEQVGN